MGASSSDGQNIVAPDRLHPAGLLTPPVFTLLLGIGDAAWTDQVMERAAAIGAGRIVPVIGEYTTLCLARTGYEAQRAHWQDLIAATCRRLGRAALPRVEPVAPLDTVLARAGEPGRRWRHDPAAALAVVAGTEAITLLVGPPAGLSEGEQAVAAWRGYLPVRLALFQSSAT